MIKKYLVLIGLIGICFIFNHAAPWNEMVWAQSDKADKCFDDKNYKDAAELYATLLKTETDRKKQSHISDRLIICRLRLQLFDQALEAAENYVTLCKDAPYEARAERLAGNLYMLIPHWGTRAGGKFHRAQWSQGIQACSYQYDKKFAVAHMEKARLLYTRYDGDDKALSVLPDDELKNWHNERIECIFDLAGLCSRFGIYENDWSFWYSYWGERDDFTAETAGERDFDEYNSRWQLQRKRPVGLRLDQNGKPVFATAPKNYSEQGSDDQKILYLLREIRELDKTLNHKYIGLSYYRQAMLARTHFGMDRMNSYAGMYYWEGAYPLQKELASYNPWELKDNETITLVGGQIKKIELPPEWNVLELLRIAVGDYAQCGIADEAQYTIGLYYQSRQQYTSALAEYAKLNDASKSSQFGKANTQVERIKASQVMISQTGVQLPGEPAKLQLSYRNASKVWFVARKIDLEGFLNELRGEDIDPDKGMTGFWVLNGWHSYFVNNHNYDNWIYRIVDKYLGNEVIRWTDALKDDGTYRYNQVTLQTPLDKRGAYLVYAYLNEPPADDAKKSGRQALSLGNSRAVVVLADLAMVEKQTSQGKLYFICDARTGAPVPEAKVDVLEVWHTWDDKGRKSVYHKTMHNLLADKDGIALLNRTNQNSQLHVLVKSGDGRLAWSGMSYWYQYHPSGIKSGLFAYCITDRPVYRPEQTVRFKVWLRQMNNGILQNQPNRQAYIEIYDQRGNKVYNVAKQSDQYGGLDGDFTLGAEPTLGVYRIQISSSHYIGGQNFRVEEYKKPEFEVTVEPGKTHAKLGDEVTAVIKAAYYFGGAVTDATVKYKVFRQEYTHNYYFPGEWDWLYGAGYGYGWYEYPWMPWWGRMRCCWSPPWWWWGCYGGNAPNPVRELVQQGESNIGSDGTVKVKIDTAPALRDHPDRDHLYVVEAEVRDASRRVIVGSGSVKVTRQSYYAFVQPDRGYYNPGEEMLIRVRCLTPDNKPIQAEGLITVSSVVFGGPDNTHIEESELKSWKASTDENGLLEFRMRYEKSGQLKIKFAAPDAWGKTVEGYGLVWFCGRDFDGSLYRFNNLEVITDKRTYQPGETAHLMINTKNAGSYVLFSDDVDNNHLLSWRLLHLPNKNIIVDIPITREHQPNFFVEATTVADARVHQQSQRICVPPENGIIKLTVATDKSKYKPGEQANVNVTALTLDGKPAQAQVTLSAFDKSVLYIQPEYTPPIAGFFHGRVRQHYVQMTTNLTEQFSAEGYLYRPFEQLDPYPNAWWGIWRPTVRDWRSVTDDEFNELAKEGGVCDTMSVGGSRKMKDGLEMTKSEADGAPLSPAKPGDGPAESKAPSASPEFVEAEVRQKFADTALWLTTLTTGQTGTATASFTMPENLTTWKINAWGMTAETKVGQNDTSVVTTKNLLVRLQAPRFFMEYDEVVISANIHNYLAKDKTARVSLSYPAELMQISGEPKAVMDSGKAPQSSLTADGIEVKVPSGGAVRVDWRVKVIKEGQAKITVKALTDEESDAMQMAFPVLVHGMTKQIATTGSMRPDDTDKTAAVEFTVPAKRRPELTRLEVQYAPSLVGAMMDALPYCIYYPYGCTEQTMSRLVPCLLTRKTLQNMGIKLEDVKGIRGRMDEIRRINKGENMHLYCDSPIFDSAELGKIIKEGLARIANMQNSDGGWGWWKDDSSSPYLTGYVLYALCTAQECDEQVDENMISRGMNYLKNYEVQEMRETYWSTSSTHAFAAYVLSLKKIKAVYQPAKEDKRSGDLIERLFADRDKLELYGKSLLAMVQANLNDKERSQLVLQNIMQYKEENTETQVAWFRTAERGWWYWWNSDIETNAMILRAMVKIDPKNDTAPKLVKWLLNNRRNGYYWDSTRDTTMCVAAMSDFVTASGEGKPDFTLTLDLDNGAVVKSVKINKDNFFTYDNTFVVEGVSLGDGKHTLKIAKSGPGALYFNTYLSYFTKEEYITAAGHELKVDRVYYKLVQIPYEVTVEDSKGNNITEKRLRYERVPVKDGDAIKSGDVVQVELKVQSDNDYTYLCLEDMKPAGYEPVDVRSGGKGQEGFWSYMELRDEKTVFFLGTIGQGEHLMRYRLRAEIPGIFHALPTIIYGMYAPKLRANGNENIMKVVD
ncbi:MAG: MG2 domain-containing protein [Planctomycetota bacterium]